MSKSISNLKQAGMVLGLLAIGRCIVQIFKVIDKSAQTIQIADMGLKRNDMSKQQKPLVKKHARILKTTQEQIHAITFSDDNITIHITPVSQDEEDSKRVKGYSYLSA